MYNPKPQRMGLGTTTRYIEIPIVITNQLYQFDAESHLLDRSELLNYCSRYQYLKIEKINVVIPPTSNNAEVLLFAIWNNETNVTVNDMNFNDSVKRVTVHAVKYQRRTFFPPHITSTKEGTNTGETTKLSAINLWKFNQTDNYMIKRASPNVNLFNFPLRLYYTATENVNLKATIILKCKFRGQKYSDELNKLIEFKDDEIIKNRINELIKLKEQRLKEQEDKFKEIKINLNESKSSIRSISSISSDNHNKPELTKDKLIEFMKEEKINCKLPKNFATTYLILNNIKGGAVENGPEKIFKLVEFLKKFYLDKRELKLRYGLEDDLGSFLTHSILEKEQTKEVLENLKLQDDKRINELLNENPDEVVKRVTHKARQLNKNNIEQDELDKMKKEALIDIINYKVLNQKSISRTDAIKDIEILNRSINKSYDNSILSNKSSKKRQKTKFSSL